MSLAGPVGATNARRNGPWARRYLAIVADWLATVVSRSRIRVDQPRLSWGSPAGTFVALILAVVATAGLMLFADAHTIGVEQRLSGRTQEIVATITNFGRSGW